jgi:hypothetical protein
MSLAACCVGLLCAASFAGAGPTASAASYAAPTSCGHLPPIGAVSLGHTRLTQIQAVCLLARYPKVASWLKRYPKDLHGGAVYYKNGVWSAAIAPGNLGVVARGAVDDRTGKVLVAWTGPQLSWSMARGTPGAFGGKRLNSWTFWIILSVVFFVGLADFRRPLNVRNLDLLMLLGFSVSLWYFDKGHVFASASLLYIPLVYLLGRALWIGLRGVGPRSGKPVWPVWLLIGVAVFATTFRIAADVGNSVVIDVGYSGVIGAQRIASGISPYGHMPLGSTTLKPCGPADQLGQIPYRIQSNGRCELADEHGDTYGPVAYEAYLPGYAIAGWSGPNGYKPSARITSILFDTLCLIGLVLVGRRFGGNRLAATFAFAWTTFPFTLYALGNNTNDTVQAAFLIWGFWLCSSPVARGAFGALAGWTKFAPLILAPMWATYPNGVVRARSTARYAIAFGVVTLAVFSILFLEPSAWGALKTFVNRALRWQVGRESPFSIWDWRQYHAAGLPDLHILQKALEVLLVIGAIVLAVRPRLKTPLQLAALSAALLLGFQLVQTYWFYTYIPWFLPFLLFAFFAPEPVTAEAEATEGVADRGPGLPAWPPEAAAT